MPNTFTTGKYVGLLGDFSYRDQISRIVTAMIAVSGFAVSVIVAAIRSM